MQMQRPPIRIAIFDDHVAMRDVLARALTAEGTFEVVAQGSTADEAIACGPAELPDLMILDIHMPGGGLEAVRRLYLECPIVKSVILSSDDSEHIVSTALSTGAYGYLAKGQPLSAVISDLKLIASGQSQFSPGLASTLLPAQGVATPWQMRDDASELPLTAREEQILSRYAQGLTLEEIAASIGISETTTGASLTNILHKLHENTLYESVAAQTALQTRSQ
jgi:two-component system, NarL family, nitrate/nitrite response regulator NarL